MLRKTPRDIGCNTSVEQVVARADEIEKPGRHGNLRYVKVGEK